MASGRCLLFLFVPFVCPVPFGIANIRSKSNNLLCIVKDGIVGDLRFFHFVVVVEHKQQFLCHPEKLALCFSIYCEMCLPSISIGFWLRFFFYSSYHFAWMPNWRDPFSRHQKTAGFSSLPQVKISYVILFFPSQSSVRLAVWFLVFHIWMCTACTKSLFDCGNDENRAGEG